MSKVPSSQIVSTWESYHWISLGKDINRYRFFYFFILLVNIWKTSKFPAESCKNESNLLLVRVTVCIESCLPIGWRTFIWWKIPPKCSSIWFGSQDVGILYSWAVSQRTIDVSPAFLEHGLAEKIAVWAHANRDPNKQEVGFIFAWSYSEFWTLIKYSRSKIKYQKPIAIDVLFKPIQSYHSHADPIWPDGTFYA